MASRHIRADFALGFGALIWGVSFVIVKGALAEASVFAFIAVRFTLAAILMAVVFRRSLAGLTLRSAWAGIQIGFFLFGGFAFQTAGLKYTTPSKAAFITGSGVVLVPILLGVFGRRRITSWICAGALAAFAGLYLLTVPPEGLGVLNRGDLAHANLRFHVRVSHYFYRRIRGAVFGRRAQFSASRDYCCSRDSLRPDFCRGRVGNSPLRTDWKSRSSRFSPRQSAPP